MKKLYMAALALAFFGGAKAQVLNQSAGWPNTAWTVTGNYSTDPLAFEANPTTTPNFAFDDDDAGSGGHEDNIAAESPVIDLTAAFNAGEKTLIVTVPYGYRYLEPDQLQFQYWDATAAAWAGWTGGNIPGNNTLVTDNFCSIQKTTYITNPLSIANFTPAQLAGFKYRISYDDNPQGAGWNYGFCFDSPVITSLSCGTPTSVAATDVTPFTATLSWDGINGITGFEYVLNNTETDPTAAGTATTATSFNAASLEPSTAYYFHLRVNCGTGFSNWITVAFNTTAVPPANDACADAVVVSSFPYTQTLDASAATNNLGMIDTCNGSNDGVWYTFEGTGENVTIAMTEVGDWDPEISVYTGVCGQFQCVGQMDNFGGGGSETYTVTTVTGTTYYVNLANYSGFSDGPEGLFTVTFTQTDAPQPLDNDFCSTAIAIASLPYTNTQDATLALNTGGFVTACEDAMNDGVWYNFAGTGTDVTITLTAVQGWDPQIGVYTGTCDALVCGATVDVGGGSGNETLTLSTLPNTMYYVNVGHYNGSADVAEGPYTINIEGTLAAKKFSGSSFSYYPNPVKNTLNVAYDKNIDTIEIYNLLGQRVLGSSLNAKDAKVDVSSLSQGHYVAKLTSGNEVQTVKLIKE